MTLAQLVEHLTFNQVVGGSNPPCLIDNRSAAYIQSAVFYYMIPDHFDPRADMAELADAPDLGSGGNPVQVRVLLSAAKRRRTKICFLGRRLFFNS